MARPLVLRLSLALAIAALLAVSSEQARAQTSAPVVRRMFDVDSSDVVSIAMSPDGKWVAFAKVVSEHESRIFVRPAAGGPEIPITPPGRSTNASARFSPAGNRIVYGSSMPARAGEDASYLMSVPFDTRTGRASGVPRQVTIEPIRMTPGTGPAVSPDGKWVAYLQCCKQPRLRVVSTSGGNARTLAENADVRTPVGNLAWTDDGKNVLFVVPQAGGTAWHLMRASLDGGSPVLVRKSDAPIGVLAPGGHRSAYVVPFGANQRQRELRVRGPDGSVQHRVRLPDNLDGRVVSWSADGRTLLGGVRETRAAIRVASVTGAPNRSLTSGADYDWPDGWSSDSRTIYYETSAQGVPTLGAVTMDGARRGRVESPKGGDYGFWSGVVGRYAIGVAGWIDSTRQVVTAHNLDDGTTLRITDARYQPRAQLFIRGSGGTYSVDGDAYLYFERAGESIELHSVVPGGANRILRTFPASSAGQMSVAVHAGRVMYSEEKSDSIRFIFAASATASARVVATIPAGNGAGEIAWAKDGRHVAFGGPGSSIYVTELNADGSPLGSLTRYQLPFDYMYELTLLNDARRLTMIAQPRGGPNAVLALVSLDDPSRPVILSEADGTSTWGHLMSPDGQWTAYAAELPARRSSVFRVDVPPVR